MAIVYQCDASGFFVGETDDYGGPLPNNATRSAPDMEKGYIPRWNGTAWKQVENHKGEQGWLYGKPHIINQYGPYPDGWSDTAPEPTEKEKKAQHKAEILAAMGELDRKSGRALRAFALGEATEEDKVHLADYEAQVHTLRTELESLG